MWLVRLSIERPIFVTMITMFMVVLGLVSYARIGIDQFPKIEPPVITVTTEYPGAGPLEIESLVSRPLEEEINQIGGIETLTSTSRDSFSQIVVEFKLSVDAKEALENVRDKVSRGRDRLPQEVDEPLIERLDFANRPISRIAIERLAGERKVSDSYLRFLGDEVYKPRFQTVEGVGRVEVFGGLEREVCINLDLQKILAFGLTPKDVSDAIKQANLNVSAGVIKEEPTGRALRVLGEFSSVQGIGHVIVKTLPGGTTIKVKDLGEVKDGTKDRTSLARVDRKPVVMIEVYKQTDANTVAVAKGLMKRIDELNAAGGEAHLRPVFDGARPIRNTLHDVSETLLIAAILAVIVVYFFLGSAQSTFITGLALPTTMIGICTALYLFDHTLNIMTLLGITLSVGLILDDAIVVRENIWTKMEMGLKPREAALKGTEQVYTAVLATSLTVLAVFIPVTFIPGVVGKFFAAFALTVCFGVIYSTFDALTMAPMLSAHWVHERKEGEEKKRPNIFLRIAEDFGTNIAQKYERILNWALRSPRIVIFASIGLFLASLVLGRFIGFTFLPQDENGELEISLTAPAGTTIQSMDTIVKQFESYFARQSEIKQESTRIGNDFGDENVALLFVQLVPAAERSVTTGDMIARFQNDLRSIAEKSQIDLGIRPAGGGGQGKPVNMVIQGPDNATLAKIANQVVYDGRSKLTDLANIDSNLKPGRGEVQIVIDHSRLAEFGLTTEAVGSALRGLYEGDLAGVYREHGAEFDIRVRLQDRFRVDLGTIQQMTIPNKRGEQVPLQAVASLVSAASPTKIVRINQMRAALIEADLRASAPLATAITNLKAFVQPLLPPGYRIDLRGQAKSLGDLAFGAIMALGLGALFIYMIMASLYESFLIPFSILLTLPLAIVGAMSALFLSGHNLDVYGVIGIILLMGLVTKNAILLVDYVEKLRADGASRMDALLEAGRRRLRPIMMTTVAMIAGMMPVAMGMGEVNKIRAGMGIASIGGMLSSTLLSLVVVPCVYVYLDRMREWSKSRS